jgi:hypothetical protein
LREKKELLVLVLAIVNLVGRLRSVREDLKDGRLVDAAEEVKELKKSFMIHNNRWLNKILCARFLQWIDLEVKMQQDCI